MKTWLPTGDAVQFLCEAQTALSEIESHGMRIDRAYLTSALDSTQKRIRALEEELRTAPEYAEWRRMFGAKTNIASPEQLSRLVFGDKSKGGLGFHSKVKTKGKNRASAAEAALESVDRPFVKQYLQAQKLRKARGTYLEGIARELVQHDDGDSYIHPSFNMNMTQTMRSSCDSPNVQNQPNRNPEMAEIVRRCFIPRRGHQIVEIDYAQQEVRVGICYHHDPNMLRYVSDPTTDMHRDTAAKMFFLTTEQAKNKSVRHLAKNQFVFPQFYGSYFAQCAPNIWLALNTDPKPEVAGTKTTVLDHLASKGITRLGACDPKERPEEGTFEHHLKKIEDFLWGEQFPVYAQWKKDWFAAYQRDGGCRFHTGFVMTGPHKKNDITNYCIQGDSSNCMVWSLIRINRILRRYKMRSRAICEIHDCIVFDAHPSERDDLIHICRQVMVRDVTKAWPWIIAPLEVEAEVCPVDRSWHDKVALTEKDGVFVPADISKWVKKYGDWQLQCA